MSCETNSRRCATSAASQNGIWGQVNRYLNTVGNWSTYRDLKSIDQVPERLEQVTAAFFGVSGLNQGMPRLSGILGVIIGIHTLEQVTAAAATTGMRMFGRGRPLAKYRGVIVRRSPLTARKAKLLKRLTGGRVLAAEGYYFHEGGRTWHGQSLTVAVRGVPRTLTHLRSFSLPYREHFFDRPLTLNQENSEAGIGDDAAPRSVSIQRVIDTVLGDEDPANIPGYIGSTNEFENATSLGPIKRVFFAANWFLVDESERDIPSGPNFVDYDALARGRSPGSQGRGYYQVNRPGSGNSGYGWPSTAGRTVPVRSASSRARPLTGLDQAPSANQPYGTNLFRSGSGRTPPPPPSSDDPYLTIQDRYHHPNGRQYPLVVKRIVTNPVTHVKKAVAIYYDGEMKTWREIVDDDTRQALAQEVASGNLKVAEEWP